jgi:hypothetical protein
MADMAFAQVIADELAGGKRVVGIEPHLHPLGATLVFEDGSRSAVTGYLAWKVRAVQKEPPVDDGSIT